MRTQRKLNPAFAAGLALLCVTLLTLCYNSGLVAKYTTRSAGEDGAGVAGFNVVFNGEELEAENCNGVFTAVSLDGAAVGTGLPAASYTYRFTVSNSSEVAVRYTPVLTFEDELPDYIKITQNGSVISPTDAGNRVYTLAGGDLAPDPGAPAAEVNVVFEIDLDKYTDDRYGLKTPETGFDIANFEASVRFVQID